jgi:tetratricopeptide (TPR) repeat protein
MVQNGQTVESNARRRFAAFISYAHADAAIAGKLQSRLERYRLPKHIAAVHADGQAALGQIFRDREDLAAAPSLSDAIRDAIAEAEALIVLCSPDAKASRWVGEEIALFRSLHPDRPILAALVRGEPDEAFPAALTESGNEPLAADLRKEGDGEALGFLKIVAGIAGVPLDTLVQRDAQRRIRRVMWITGGALAAMLVMGVMTTLAIQARNEAARQRAASDGLVEYMLTDLREKLRGVGRSEIMRAVNQRALQHYAAQGELADLPADSLEHRARVLHAMGDDDHRNGQLDLALLRFREAHTATETLLKREPSNPDRIFAHAQSEYYVGRIALDKGDELAAQRHWNQYLLLANSLVMIEPRSFRSLMELGYAEGNLCEVALKNNKHLDFAERHCRRAIMHENNALSIRPNDKKTRQDIANRWGWLARVQVAKGDLNGAIESRKQEIQLMDALIEDDPSNMEYVLRRSWATVGITVTWLNLGKPVQARELLVSEITLFERRTANVTGDLRVSETKVRLLSQQAKAETLIYGKPLNDTLDRISASISGPNAKKLQKIKYE